MLLDIMAYYYTLFVTSHVRCISTAPLCRCLLFARYGPWDPRFINADNARQVFVIWLDDVLAFNPIVLIVFVKPRGTAFLIFLVVVVVAIFEV